MRMDPQQPSRGKRVRPPRLSGKAVAAWLILYFVLTGRLIPAVLRLPRWVEFEIVLAAWGMVWLIVLARLLYTGRLVSHDYRWDERYNWLGLPSEREMDRVPPTPSQPDAQSERERMAYHRGLSHGLSWGSLWGPGDATAELGLILGALLLLFGVVRALTFLAVPVVVFLLYFMVRGMLARVVNDRHHCRGRLARALGCGFLWATVYTAPLAGAVWFVHYVVARQASP